MSEKPILFNAEMVRAVLDGRKTQTRRPIKPRHDYFIGENSGGSPWPYFAEYVYAEPEPVPVPCPFGCVGDRLWVRETWAEVDLDYTRCAAYRADDEKQVDRWRPSIHMPRWASRITLEIINIRVQRLTDVTEVDATAEGFVSDRIIKYGRPWGGFTARDYFCGFWDATYGPGKLEWPHNPWVWAITFKRLEV